MKTANCPLPGAADSRTVVSLSIRPPSAHRANGHRRAL